MHAMMARPLSGAAVRAERSNDSVYRWFSARMRVNSSGLVIASSTSRQRFAYRSSSSSMVSWP